MSDDEGFVGGSAPPDDELSLPRATVSKLIQGKPLSLKKRCIIKSLSTLDDLYRDAPE